jgi:orotate phosphoribosyltransferase-like protein
MQNKNIISRQLILIATVFLCSCTVNVHIDGISEPIQSIDKQTGDLGDVKTDAFDIAGKVGKEQVLVVFDIDNTLMAMEQGLGADQWYEWQKGLNKTDLCNSQNVGDRFAVQGALYFVSAMRKTQPDAATQVKAIQDEGIPVIALTSRGMDYRLQTFRELRRNGFDFNHSSIGPAGGLSKPFIPVQDGRFSLYDDGVFMTAGQHKGQMLLALLEKTDTPMPRVIVMADDKQENLEAVKETFSALEIPVRAWRITTEDENFANFDTHKAADEWQQMEHALRTIQQVIGPDNYDLTTATTPQECLSADKP